MYLQVSCMQVVMCYGDVVLLFRIHLRKCSFIACHKKEPPNLLSFFQQQETEQSKGLIYSYLRNGVMEPTFLVNHCLGCDETAQAE